MRKVGCLLGGLVGVVGLAVAVLWGAWSLYEARLDARLRAQVAEAGLAEHVAWDDLDASLSATYRNAQTASLEATKRMILDVDAHMSGPQRARAIRRILSYRDDFTALAADK